jgi:hypothetical protein
VNSDQLDRDLPGPDYVWQEGHAAGMRWATQRATWTQVRRLADYMCDNYGEDNDWSLAQAGGGPHAFAAVASDSCPHDFWRAALSEAAGRVEEWEFLLGFAAGVMEVAVVVDRGWPPCRGLKPKHLARLRALRREEAS